MPKKIAPWLHLILKEWERRNGKTDWHAKGSAELRALLAVARAARSAINAAGMEQGVCEDPLKDGSPLHRALERLNKISEGGRP